MSKLPIGAAVLVAVAACQSLAVGSAPMRQLRTLEIEKLLAKGALLRAEPCAPGAPYLQEERFGADGSYIAYADRADNPGRAVIANDQLCVVVLGEKHCRRLLEGPSGTIWQDDVAAGPTSRRQVKILAVDTALNCAQEVKP